MTRWWILTLTLLVLPAHADHPRPNGVMMQYFHWYTPKTNGPHGLWNEVAHVAPTLASKGITALWLPPAYKGKKGIDDVGYGVYDRYDLGEFDQKGSVSTKYGTLREYQNAIASAHQAGIDIIADIVLNHLVGADDFERVKTVEVDPKNRNVELPGTEREIRAETLYRFPGRAGRYSSFVWHWTDFTASDWDENTHRRAIYKHRGMYPGFQEEVDHENGNYDYLLGEDIDMRNPEVRTELKTWGNWYIENLHLDGVRLDAVKHFPFQFAGEWLGSLRRRGVFAVGEYWSDQVERLEHYTQVTQGRMLLFDAPLHYKFFAAGQANGNFDLRTLLDRTWVQARPELAVTFVENHDTQPLQALESPVADWFKPLAYAVILLRSVGYPCLFYADYFGADYTDHGHTVHMTSFQRYLDAFLFLRYKFAYGPERDYFDHWDVVGWTRAGDAQHPGGMAVLINDNRTAAGQKRMCVGARRTDAVRKFIDFTRSVPGEVTLDAQGCGTFSVRPGSVSVWVDEQSFDAAKS